jgi:hypothetical protein
MLTANPADRATVIDLFEDPWLTRNSMELIDLFQATQTMSKDLFLKSGK